MRLIITRPIADSQELAQKLSKLGHESITSPLLTIEARPDVAIPRQAFQAIALTSANALLSTAFDTLKHVPVFAVGAQSAGAARRKGFVNVTTDGGDVTGLAAAIARHCDPARGPILYPSGAETSGDLKGSLEKKGFEVARVILYDAVPAKQLEPEAAAALVQRKVNGVLLYSPRSARIWVDLLARAQLTEAAGPILHFCLSQNVAAQLGSGFTTRIAATPDEPSLLALLDRAM